MAEMGIPSKSKALSAYYRAVYAETQDLLAASLGADAMLKIHRGTSLNAEDMHDLVRDPEDRLADVNGPVTQERNRYFNEKKSLRARLKVIDTDNMDRQPLTSWSTNRDVARAFSASSGGGMGQASRASTPIPVLQSAETPISWIWSSTLTGPGCYIEDEVIALDAPGVTRLQYRLPGKATISQDFAEAYVGEGTPIVRDADGDGWIHEGTDEERRA